VVQQSKWISLHSVAWGHVEGAAPASGHYGTVGHEASRRWDTDVNRVSALLLPFPDHYQLVPRVLSDTPYGQLEWQSLIFGVVFDNQVTGG
jgi:hypothetical protein